jgi:hypothetical protein
LLELGSWWPEPAIQVNDDVLRHDARAEINAKVLNVWLCVEDERVRGARGRSAVNETGLAGNSAQHLAYLCGVTECATSNAILLNVQGVACAEEKCDANERAHET